MAKVKVLRTDYRLIHGQVAMSWLNIIAPNAILIANDALVNDEIGKMAVKLAKPQGMKIAIRTIDEAIELVKNPKTADMQLFGVCKNLRDTVKLIEGIGPENVGTVNVGGSQKKKDGKQLWKGMIFDEDDIVCLKRIVELVGNDNVDSRTIPSDAKVNLDSILKNL